MMLPKEIKEARFSRAFKGYSDREVDEFLNRVLEDYGQLYRDNAELEHKIEILADKIREYKNAEQALDDAKKKVLRLAQEKVSEARDEAARIEREARERAERILIDAKRDAERERRNYERLQLEVTRFKNKAINIFRSEIDQLNNLPSLQVSPQEMMRIQTESMMEEPAPAVVPQEEESDAVSIMRAAAANAAPVETKKPSPIKSIVEEVPDTPPDMDIFGNSLNFDEKTEEEKAREERRSHAFTLNVKPKTEEAEEEVITRVMSYDGAPKADIDESLAEKPLTIDPEPMIAEPIIEQVTEPLEPKEHQAAEETELKPEHEEVLEEGPRFIRVESPEIDSIIRQNQGGDNLGDTKVLPLAEEEDVRPTQGETGNFEIIDTNGNERTDKETVEPDEHPRFGQLRFGDDYDLENDDFRGGIFRRKKKKKD